MGQGVGGSSSEHTDVRSFAEAIRGVSLEKKVTLANRGLKCGHKLSYVCRRDEELTTTIDEVQDARRYWMSALIGYILGERIPYSVMERFVDRQWSGVVKTWYSSS